MIARTELSTPRLLLRPFAIGDASEVERLCGERAIAATTLLIPHPYPQGAAAVWIGKHDGVLREGTGVTFAIVQREGDHLTGAIGLGIDAEHRRAELGYWIGVPYWGRGYCTEAASAVVDYGFRVLELHRIYAHHMTHNPASGRVLRKIGMCHEGKLREHMLKWGEFVDLELYGMLRGQWEG